MTEIDEDLEETKKGYPVKVNVYDLLLGGQQGLYHSGTEIRKREYAFGASRRKGTGVWIQYPTISPGFCVFKSSMDIGFCTLSDKEIDDILYSMRDEYQGQDYNLVRRNCNIFTNDLIGRLCGKKLPGWVNRPAGFALAIIGKGKQPNSKLDSGINRTQSSDDIPKKKSLLMRIFSPPEADQGNPSLATNQSKEAPPTNTSTTTPSPLAQSGQQEADKSKASFTSTIDAMKKKNVLSSVVLEANQQRGTGSLIKRAAKGPVSLDTMKKRLESRLALLNVNDVKREEKQIDPEKAKEIAAKKAAKKIIQRQQTVMPTVKRTKGQRDQSPHINPSDLKKKRSVSPSQESRALKRKEQRAQLLDEINRPNAKPKKIEPPVKPPPFFSFSNLFGYVQTTFNTLSFGIIPQPQWKRKVERAKKEQHKQGSEQGAKKSEASEAAPKSAKQARAHSGWRKLRLTVVSAAMPEDQGDKVVAMFMPSKAEAIRMQGGELPPEDEKDKRPKVQPLPLSVRRKLEGHSSGTKADAKLPQVKQEQIPHDKSDYPGSNPK